MTGLRETTILVLACSILQADTVGLRDDRYVNGKVLRMVNGEITLVAGDKTLTINKAQLAIIEFNGTTSNLRPPNLPLGLGPPLQGREASVLSSDDAPGMIVFLGGIRRLPCNLTGIDDQSALNRKAAHNNPPTRRKPPVQDQHSVSGKPPVGDTQWVHCEGKDYPKSDVLRIVLVRRE